MAGEQFIVITPAKNESKYLGKVIESIVSQTIPPCEWVIVDDGSIDNTANIAEEAAVIYPWINVVRNKDRGYRDIGYGDVEAFNKGYTNIESTDYTILFRIDADIILGQKYFETILEKFAANPNLGIAVGEVFEPINGRLIKLKSLPFGFNGMIKGWRRKCFQEIGGLPRGPGWDGIDCFRAMMLGWETKTFPDAELRVTHLRPEGSSIKSQYHGWARQGKALHFAGASPVWLLASAMYHMLDRPFVLGGLCMIIGYLEEWLKNSPQYGDQEFRRFLRAWHRKELGRILKCG
jgi:biofilm PGA synthesis N-glycosyltransferase PgaC